MTNLSLLSASVAEHFWRQVDKTPDALALSSDKSSKTYQQLEYEANSIAHAIQSNDAIQIKAEGQIVALLMEHSTDLITTILGVSMSGCVYQPLDTRFPEAQLKIILASTQARAIIVSDAYAELAARVISPGTVIFSIKNLLENKQISRILKQADMHAPAYLLSTSGSTGRPKNILHSQQNMLRAVSHYCNDLCVHESDNIALILPCTYTPALYCIFGALLSGATLYPFDLKNHTIEEMALWIKRAGISLLYSTPTIYRRLINDFPDNTIFDSLRGVQLAGEALFKSDVDAYQQRFAEQFSLYNGMGATETACLTRNFIDAKTIVTGSRVPLGQAYDDVQIKILDESGQAVPEGQEGELYVVGKYFARGYYNNPDLSMKQFAYAEDGSDFITYRTGDRAYITKKHELVHLGRIDSQVKVRGQRVELEEIEATMLRSKIAQQAAVIMISEEGKDPFLAAFFQPEQDITAIRRYLSEQLPPFMIPTRIVSMVALPTNVTGKVDKLALSHWKFSSHLSAEKDDSSASDLIEQHVLECFRDVLKAPRLKINSNFFDYGGDSLLAVELAISLQRALAVPIDASSLIESPTPKAMAAEAHRLLSVGGVKNLVRFQDEEFESARSSDNIPIFCLPGADGSALTFRALAAQMLKTRAVYAMEYSDYGEEETAIKSLDELIERCFESINTAYPDGPLAFVCYSLGGVVGFELVRKFEAAGRPVQLLAMMDCFAPQSIRLQHPIEELKRYSKSIINGCKRIFKQEPKDIVQARRTCIRAALSRAAFYYQPRAQRISNMLLVKAGYEGRMWGIYDRYAQWDRLVPNGFRSISVPSDHVSILLPDKALAIAQFINEAMPSLIASKGHQIKNKVLHALNDMWAIGNDEILSVGEINDADVKPEHKSLLGEEKQLTQRLEAHLKDTIEPKVLKSQQRGRLYYRKVALQTKNTQRSAAVAVIRIAMDQFERDVIEEIIQGERSFGTILSNRNIVYSCSSVNLFQAMPDKSLGQEFELGDEVRFLCGRTNQFKNSEGAVLADVLEILAPWV